MRRASSKTQPKRLSPGLLVPDAHVPYHDRQAWGLMLRVARDLGVEWIAVLGDLADCFSISTHLKDPNRARLLDQEIAEVNVALDQLDALGAKTKLYVAGNHENRLERYTQQRAPELFNLLRWEQMTRLKERGWRYAPYRDTLKLGKLHLTHDVGSAGRNAVYKCLDTYQHSIATGHTHRMALIVEGNATGEHKVSAQFGWLGDVTKADYMHQAMARKNWPLGFGLGWHDEDTGHVFMQPVPVVKGTVCVNGRLYKA